MRFVILAAAALAASVQASDIEVLQLFVGQANADAEPEKSVEELAELDEEDAYEQQLNSISACDPAYEDTCNVYGLVELADAQTAIVNLGEWNELKSGLETVSNNLEELDEDEEDEEVELLQ